MRVASGLGLFSSALFLLPAPVWAQSAPSPTGSDDGLKDIVVTAQKRSQSVEKVGMTITAASGDQLKARGVNDVADLVKIEPSFVVAQNSVGQPVFSIRGVSYNSTSVVSPPAVSVYLDEVAYPYAALSKGATLDLERVEILKGPQGTLFGQNATGGAINYIAAKPTDIFKFGIDATYARFNAVKLDGFVSGPLTSTLRARLAVSTEQGGAWQRSVTRDDRLGDKNNRYARLLLDWTPTDKLTLSLNVNGWTDKSDNQAPALYAVALQFPALASHVPLVLGAPIAPHDPRAADWVPGTHPRNDEGFYQTSLRADYKVSDALRIVYLGTYEHYRSNDLLSYTGTETLFDTRQQAHISSTSQELRLSGKLFDSKLEWLVGGTYSKDKSTENSIYRVSGTTTAFTLVGLPGVTQPIGVVVPFMTQDVESKAVFGNVEYHILPTLSLHGGVRYTETDNAHTGCTKAGDQSVVDAFNALQVVLKGGVGVVPVVLGGCDSLSPVTLSPTLNMDSLNQHNVSWRVGIDWTPIPKTLIYATVSKGYKAGSYPNIATASNYSLQSVTQESVLAYELGFKSRLDDNHLQIDGAVFYYKYKDKQEELPELDPLGVFGLLNSVLNVPDSEERGAELSIRYIPVRGLTLRGAATYLDSKVKGDFINFDQFANVTNFKGEPLPNTPKWAVSAGAQYDWRVGARYEGFLGVDVRYLSRTQSYFGAAHAVAAGFPSEFNEPYALLNLRGGVSSNDGHWRVEAFGDNVTNTYYTTQSVRVDTVARYLGMPATYGLRVAYRY